MNNTKKNKILFFVPNYLPHLGGVEKHVKFLSEELLADGNEVYVIVCRNDISLYERNYIGKIEVIRLHANSTKIYPHFSQITNLFKIRNEIEQANIIHFHDYKTMYIWGIPAYLIFKLFKKRVYITFHGWEGILPIQQKTILLRRFCEFITNGSICIGHFIIKWYGTQSNIVSYGGVTPKKIINDSAIEFVDKQYALFIGRIEHDTGIIDYVQAWRKINERCPDLLLVVCGDGTLKQDVELIINKHCIKNIIFKGFVEDINQYISQAEFVFASGYLAILESFSYYKPVIAFYDNELKKDYLEMIPNSSEMMWITNDHNGIRHAVQEVREKGTVTKSKIEKAYLYSRENNWTKVKEDYYRLWDYK